MPRDESQRKPEKFKTKISDEAERKRREKTLDEAIENSDGFAVVCTENLNPDVLVMQPAEDWDPCDAAELLGPPKIRRIFGQ